MARTDGRTDQIARNPDAGGGTAATCTTLVWQFGGRRTPMLDECGHEYANLRDPDQREPDEHHDRDLGEIRRRWDAREITA